MTVTENFKIRVFYHAVGKKRKLRVRKTLRER